MKKIVKFGGSSLANAEQFQKVGEIIRSDESRRYVVPSAPGKRFDGDTKVTDLLYKCYNTAVEGEDFIPILQEIKGRYYEIIRGLNLDLSLEDEFVQIEADFRAQAGTDYAASRGEFLNGKVMAAYLIRTEIWMPRRQTDFCPKSWQNVNMPLSLDFMALVKMEKLKLSPEEVLM